MTYSLELRLQSQDRLKVYNTSLAMEGGFYERMVALFKSAFKKTVGKSLLQLEHLQTVIVEIESVINSRALSPYRESDSLAHVLKPIDFVSPAVDIQLPPSQQPELQDASNKLTDWYQQSIRVLDSFWDISHQDYLSALRERHQQGVRRQRARNITPHECQVVLNADDKLPRGPLATWNHHGNSRRIRRRSSFC
ncbi:unnamed protein product [Heligmosomoides polygyrus]|uniref:DUF1758 domain-containing protein n=1 Tax=Heligmosomoides polygyrus TaxID=6339 RepID=A0A183GAA9_HELPZ|nr:unnamed protein product [Heligmosomoides polygyrus]